MIITIITVILAIMFFAAIGLGVLLLISIAEDIIKTLRGK